MSATGWLPLVAAALLMQAGCADHGDYDYAVSPGPVTSARKPPAKRAPSPDQALLAPQRKPDCESGTAVIESAQAPAARVARRDGESAQPAMSASDAQSAAAAPPDTGVDMALRIKLEYERECYKQAEIRVRERLLRLQAWTAETIKASDR